MPWWLSHHMALRSTLRIFIDLQRPHLPHYVAWRLTQILVVCADNANFIQRLCRYNRRQLGPSAGLNVRRSERRTEDGRRWNASTCRNLRKITRNAAKAAAQNCKSCPGSRLMPSPRQDKTGQEKARRGRAKCRAHWQCSWG